MRKVGQSGRCRAHGLVAGAEGLCAVCRRQHGALHRRRVLRFVGGLAALVGAAVLVQTLRALPASSPKAAPSNAADPAERRSATVATAVRAAHEGPFAPTGSPLAAEPRPSATDDWAPLPTVTPSPPPPPPDPEDDERGRGQHRLH